METSQPHGERYLTSKLTIKKMVKILDKHLIDSIFSLQLREWSRVTETERGGRAWTGLECCLLTTSS